MQIKTTGDRYTDDSMYSPFWKKKLFRWTLLFYPVRVGITDVEKDYPGSHVQKGLEETSYTAGDITYCEVKKEWGCLSFCGGRAEERSLFL